MSDSIRDDALAAIATVEAAETEAASSVETTAAPTAAATEKPADAPAEGAARDASGKFAPKETKVEGDPAKPADAKPEGDKPATETKADEPKGPEAPANWSKADREMFAKQSPEVQKYLTDRDSAMTAAYTRKTQEVAHLKTEFQPIADLLAPHTEAMKARGFTPSSLIQGWYAVEKRLSEGQGIDVIKGLVNGYNIDIAQLAESLGLKGLHAPVSDAAKQPIHQTQLPPELLTEINGLRDYVNKEKQNKALDNQRSVEQQIDSFVKATDKDGVLLHPHFAELEADMAAIHETAKARGGALPTLDQLYETAVWANPSTRALMTQAQRDAFEREAAAKEEERTQQVRARAEAARKAGSSIRGAPGSGQAPDAKRGGRSLRDDLMEAAEDL